MNSESIIKDELGNYSVQNSIFDSNQGVRVTKDYSNLVVDSCFFISCRNNVGGALYFRCPNGYVMFNKVCGKDCYLTATESFGIFYYTYGSRFINLVSYYDNIIHSSSRDLLNHDIAGSLDFKNVNVSNTNCKYRSFAWFRIGNGNSMTASFCYSSNITCCAEKLQVFSGANAVFNFFCLLNCNTKAGGTNGEHSAITGCLFATLISTTIRNSYFLLSSRVNIFNSNPTLVGCSVNYMSLDSNYIDIKTLFVQYLNTYECVAAPMKRRVNTLKTYGSFPNSFVLQLIWISS
jgi:hypothetical protein